MGDYVYTTVPGKIGPLLTKIREIGIPPKVTQAWMKTIGFKSSNDGTLVTVLKAAGLVDSSGVPTDIWRRFRGSGGKAALAEGIMSGYAPLFAVYPDAHLRSRSELESVFSESTRSGKVAIGKMVGTFKGLTDQADFSSLTREHNHVDDDVPVARTKAGNAEAKTAPSPSSGAPSVHIDVQVHIASDASPDQIDQIFASMAKHLYGKS